MFVCGYDNYQANDQRRKNARYTRNAEAIAEILRDPAEEQIRTANAYRITDTGEKQEQQRIIKL